VRDWLFGRPAIEPSPTDPTEADRFAGHEQLVFEAFERLGRAVDLTAWQKKGGLPHLPVIVRSRYAEVDSPTTTSIRREVDLAQEQITCDLVLPAAWRRRPADGLAAIRLQRAILAALDAIGQHFALGPVPVRAPTGEASAPDSSPFPPPDEERPYEDLAGWVADVVATLDPQQALILARSDVPKRIAQTQERLVKQVGTVLTSARHNPERGKETTSWLVRTSW
jgi:hypothetical protein